jgi:hypothetical protein
MPVDPQAAPRTEAGKRLRRAVAGRFNTILARIDDALGVEAFAS